MSHVGLATPAGARTNGQQHVTVCVCTYKRPQLLLGLLTALGGQDTGELFTYSVMAADNDCLESARTIVSDLAAAGAILMSYCVEPRGGEIVVARSGQRLP